MEGKRSQVKNTTRVDRWKGRRRIEWRPSVPPQRFAGAGGGLGAGCSTRQERSWWELVEQRLDEARANLAPRASDSLGRRRDGSSQAAPRGVASLWANLRVL